MKYYRCNDNQDLVSKWGMYWGYLLEPHFYIQISNTQIFILYQIAILITHLHSPHASGQFSNSSSISESVIKIFHNEQSVASNKEQPQ